MIFLLLVVSIVLGFLFAVIVFYYVKLGIIISKGKMPMFSDILKR